MLLPGHEYKYIKYYHIWSNKQKDRAKLFTHWKVFKNISVLHMFATSFINEDEISLCVGVLGIKDFRFTLT